MLWVVGGEGLSAPACLSTPVLLLTHAGFQFRESNMPSATGPWFNTLHHCRGGGGVAPVPQVIFSKRQALIDHGKVGRRAKMLWEIRIRTSQLSHTNPEEQPTHTLTHPGKWQQACDWGRQATVDTSCVHAISLSLCPSAYLTPAYRG